MDKPTILIVDDERFFINLLIDILQTDYQIITASCGAEALQQSQQHEIDLILLDIIMPDMDGYEICGQLKSLDNTRSIPIIFLTVKNSVADETKGFELGAVEYITKPISPPIVKARIKTQLELLKIRQSLIHHNNHLEILVAEKTVELTREIAKKQKAYEKLHYLANYDQLTQLPNRNLFNERLTYTAKQFTRNKTAFALLLIDLDRFKHINDSMGHHIGDLLLAKVGKRLSGCLRHVDTIARLGGDEFTVTLTDVSNREDIAIVANKIIAAFKAPFQLCNQDIYISASIGIACCPEDTEDIQSLLKFSDMAMYEAKKKGKNTFEFFSKRLTTHANHRMTLEKDLRKALADNELFLNYQPIIELQSGRNIGVEALLRWRHPEHGLIPPDKFIPIAEESDLILSIGNWVFRTACKQVQSWRNAGIKQLNLAVNMSTRQFCDKADCVGLVQKTLAELNLPAHSLTLEITENLMLEDSQQILNIFKQLQKLGVKLSVDDFGTGYSSLSYLRRFPINVLKIDRSFIQELEMDTGDAALVKAIIAMGKSLQLSVIAEGVESPGQYRFLMEHACDLCQGYYFSKPVAASEIEKIFLAGQSRQENSG